MLILSLITLLCTECAVVNTFQGYHNSPHRMNDPMSAKSNFKNAFVLSQTVRILFLPRNSDVMRLTAMMRLFWRSILHIISMMNYDCSRISSHLNLFGRVFGMKSQWERLYSNI